MIYFLDSCGDHYNTNSLTRKWQFIDGDVKVVLEGRVRNCIKLGVGARITRKIGTFSPGPIIPAPQMWGHWCKNFIPIPGKNVLIDIWDSGIIHASLIYNTGKLQIRGPGLDINGGSSIYALLYEVNWTIPTGWFAIEFELRTGNPMQFALAINGIELTDNITDTPPLLPWTGRFTTFGGGPRLIDDIYIGNSDFDDANFGPEELSRRLSLLKTPGIATWVVDVLKPNGEGLHLAWDTVPKDYPDSHFTLINKVPSDFTQTTLKSSVDEAKETYQVEDISEEFSEVWAAQNVLSIKGAVSGGQFTHLKTDEQSGAQPEATETSEPYGEQPNNEPGNLIDWDYWVYGISPIWDIPKFNLLKWGFSKENTTEIQVTQGIVEVLLPEIPLGTESTVIEIIPLFTYHRFTKLWELVRKDGTTFRFTDHNTDIVNPEDGFTYTPLLSFATSAHQRTTGIDPNNLEIQGLIGTLAFNDFLAGKYNGARITEYLIDWQYPWAGIFLATTIIIEASSFDAAKWTGQAASIALPLLRSKGHVYGRTCRHILGDLKCKVNLSVVQESGTATATNTNRYTQIEANGSGLFGTDSFGNDKSVINYWGFGDITWTSGNNNGLKREVRESSVLSANILALFSLQTPLPFLVEAGDTFTITPGCNKLWSTCKDKFENPTDGDIDCGNTKNFGGFPTIPGKDGIFSPIGEATRVFSNEQVQNWLLDFLIRILF